MTKKVRLGASDLKAPALMCALLGAAVMLAGCPATSTREPPPAYPTAQESLTAAKPVCPELSARDLEREAIELLDRGQSDQARTLLDCAIEANPRSKRASSLIRQLEADPVAYLGAKHYMYTVQNSETLSKIAQDRLNSGLEFVILARYNNIPVPANLVAGQTIKIPGDRPVGRPADELDDSKDEAPLPGPAATMSEPVESAAQALVDDALAKEQAGDLNGAYKTLQAAQAQDSDLPGIDDDIARVRKSLIASLEEKAYGDELDGNRDAAIETWRRLLEVDPFNIPAQLSIRRLSP